MRRPIASDYLKTSKLPILPVIASMTPWDVVSNIEKLIIPALLETLDFSSYNTHSSGQFVHKSSVIEKTAQLKGPMIIGPSCFVANGSLLRGGIILDADCIVGHCGELKTSIMLTGSKIAHLNFVGDSILGGGSNVEGGAIIANYRNEYVDKEIVVLYKSKLMKTGVDKFGAILGDNSRVGANAVIAPGTMLVGRSIVKRGSSIDQCDI